MGIKVSQEGLRLVDQSRVRKGFTNKYGEDWARLAFTTPSTLKRFWQRKAIQPSAFMAICRAVDCDWHDIAEPSSFLADPGYVRRPPIETECHAALRRSKALVRIKAPMRMGKTSLISELIGCGQRLGYVTIRLNLLRLDEADIRQPDRVMKWLCRNIHRYLYRQRESYSYNIDKLNIDDCWDSAYGSNDNCTIFLEQQVLDRIDVPIVLAIDNLDRIFPYDVSAIDFLGLLRSWHEDESAPWKKLRMVLAHSTDLYPALNVEHSPFNVGKAVRLSEFTDEQVRELLTYYQVDWAPAEIAQLMSLVGGYPELIAIAVSYRKFNPALSMQNLITIAPTANGPYRSYLQSLSEKLNQQASLQAVMKALLKTEVPIAISGKAAFYLDSLGLVHLEGEQAVIRNTLYRRYFEQCLANLS